MDLYPCISRSVLATAVFRFASVTNVNTVFLTIGMRDKELRYKYKKHAIL